MKEIDALRRKAFEHRDAGLTTYEIAKDLNVSKDTIEWLLAQDSVEKPEGDIKIGWRSVGVRPARISFIAEAMYDIIIEEIKQNKISVEGIIGIAINGIPFATFVAEELDVDFSVFRPNDEKSGSFSSNYASVKDKNVVIIDDVVGSGMTLRNTIKQTKASGANVVLCVTLVNKTAKNEIDGVPVRSLIRARSI